MINEMTEFLDETIDYYSENVNRRCVDANSVCYYDPVKAGNADVSEGCAIGRKMTKAQKTKAQGYVGSLEKRFIPKALREFPLDFLRDMQRLHDHEANWEIGGLTTSGKKVVEVIRKKIEANYLPF